jgi:DNA-binding transcriptional regulator of glucitol operon
MIIFRGTLHAFHHMMIRVIPRMEKEGPKMKNALIAVVAAVALSLGSWALAASSQQGHGDMAGSGAMGQGMAEGTFTHQAVDQGVRAEFQIMSLASMKMKDTGGATHHVMVKFTREDKNESLRNVIGKIKVISPSGKEQTETLKDYGGMYAANFSFSEKGNYGIICLFKAGDQQHLIKFWYPHTS